MSGLTAARDDPWATEGPGWNRSDQTMGKGPPSDRGATPSECPAAVAALPFTARPFAGVDPISVSDIKQIINHLRDRGIGVLITDHNVRDTLDICELAFIVGEGHIIASGNANDVLNNARVRKIYLGEQFTM